MTYCCSCRLGPKVVERRTWESWLVPEKVFLFWKFNGQDMWMFQNWWPKLSRISCFFPLCWSCTIHQASQYGHAEPVVRVPWAEPVVVKRVLDLGAQSLDAQALGGIWYWEMVGVSLKMSKTNSHATPFSLRFDLSSYQHTWTSPSGCGGMGAVQNIGPARSFTGWTKKKYPPRELTSYPSKKWHIWVDDFPNFPFGGICIHSHGGYHQDITDLARPHDIQAWVACVESWAWPVWTTMVHKIHITIRRNRGKSKKWEVFVCLVEIVWQNRCFWHEFDWILFVCICTYCADITVYIYI